MVMDYEGVYDYCVKLQHQAITDAYLYHDAGDVEKFRGLLRLAHKAVAMARCCLSATEQEAIH